MELPKARSPFSQTPSPEPKPQDSSQRSGLHFLDTVLAHNLAFDYAGSCPFEGRWGGGLRRRWQGSPAFMTLGL